MEIINKIKVQIIFIVDIWRSLQLFSLVVNFSIRLYSLWCKSEGPTYGTLTNSSIVGKVSIVMSTSLAIIRNLKRTQI